MDQVSILLKDNKLKNTKLRAAVLSIIMNEGKGLSHQEISQKIKVEFDRVTLFRTLHAFEECGMLHKVLDNNGVAKYAFSNAVSVPANQGNGCHAHFVCVQCQQVFCLERDVTVSNIQVPKGFQQQSVDVQVKGLCQSCL